MQVLLVVNHRCAARNGKSYLSRKITAQFRRRTESFVEKMAGRVKGLRFS
jgi:hypothetical protein